MIDGHTDILNGIFVSAGRRASLTRDEYVFTYFLVRDKNVRSSIAPPGRKADISKQLPLLFSSRELWQEKKRI